MTRVVLPNLATTGTERDREGERERGREREPESRLAADATVAGQFMALPLVGLGQGACEIRVQGLRF